MRHVAIVGASLAGVSAAEGLRERGFDGDITLLDAEASLPYDRPPLSKGALKGDQPFEDLLLRPPSWYEEQGFHLRLGQPVRALDTSSRTLHLHGHDELRFDGLVIATGSAARDLPIPCGDPSGIHRLRLSRTRDGCAPTSFPDATSWLSEPASSVWRWRRPPACWASTSPSSRPPPPHSTGCSATGSASGSDNCTNATASTSAGRLPAGDQRRRPRIHPSLRGRPDVAGGRGGHRGGRSAADGLARRERDRGGERDSLHGPSANQRARRRGRRRCRAVAQQPLRRGDADRALDQRGGAGPARSRNGSRRAPGLPDCAVLLDRSARRQDPLRRSRIWRRRHRRRRAEARRLHRPLRPRRGAAGRGLRQHSPAASRSTARRSAQARRGRRPPASSAATVLPRSPHEVLVEARQTGDARHDPSSDGVQRGRAVAHRALPAGRRLVAADHAPARPGRSWRCRPLRMRSHSRPHRRDHHRRRGVAAGMEPHRTGGRGRPG